VDIVRFLVELGADVTAQDKDGSTPLHQASNSGEVDLARFLVEHGADATALTKQGRLRCIRRREVEMWISRGSSLTTCQCDSPG